MKNAEPTIERLLAGLRGAEPEPGMERRILEAIEARETVASFSLRNKLRPQTLPAFALQLASALAVTAALVVIAFHERSRGHEVSIHPPTLAVRLKSPAEAITPPVASSTRRPTSRVSPKHRRAAAVVPDLRAASMPAPPLPLTAQERLLLRLAHRRDPEDMAMLNSAAQSAQLARANEEFQQFFGMSATEMRSHNE